MHLNHADDIRHVRITEVRNGHGGSWQVVVVLHRPGDGDFDGVAQAMHQPSEQPAGSAHASAALSSREVTELVTAFVAGLTKPAHEPRSFDVSSDAGQSAYLAIDVVDGDGAHGLQFAADRGQDLPLPWRLRGCVTKVSTETLEDLTRRWDAVRTRVGIPALFDTLTR